MDLSSESMRAFRQFVRLSSQERKLLFKAVCLVATVRLALWVLPFRAIRGVVDRAARNPAGSAECRPDRVDNVIWAVTAASRRIPAASCLTQALASQVLLRRQGCPAVLRIGVAPGESGEVAAHAWIESNGRIVIGGSDSARRFVTLMPRTERDEPAGKEAGR